MFTVVRVPKTFKTSAKQFRTCTLSAPPRAGEVRIRARNFSPKEFSPTEDSPKGIFAERNFRLTELSSNGIFPVRNFAEWNFRRTLRNDYFKSQFSDTYSILFCEIRFLSNKLTCVQAIRDLPSHIWVTTQVSCRQSAQQLERPSALLCYRWLLDQGIALLHPTNVNQTLVSNFLAMLIWDTHMFIKI